MLPEEPFCESTILNVQTYYLENIQGSIDIPICIFGVIFNMFNMLVFTRRNLISPMNLIFTHLAFVSSSELVAYVFYTWAKLAYYSKKITYEEWTYTRAGFIMRSGELIDIFNRISVYIIIMLAIWKYTAVFHPSKKSQWCSMKTTRNTLVAGYIICILLFIPEYLSHYIGTFAIHQTTKFYLHSIKIDSIVYSAAQIIKIVLYELLPLLVLPILGVRFIVTLWTKKQHPTASSIVENGRENVKMKQTTDRSIIILTTIMALCLSCVIPSGLFDLVYTVLTRDTTHLKCFHSLIVVRNMLNCINKSITFLVYFAMDQDFRVTFKSLYNKINTSFWRRGRGNDESLELEVH